MIQRIQSIFLLVAAILSGSLFFLSMAEMANMEDLYELTWRGIYEVEAEGAAQLVMPGWALSILTGLTTLVSLITIFLFKKRLIQIRLCALNLGFLLGLSGMIYYMGKTGAKELRATELSFNWPLVLPLVAMVFVYLALRAIGKDEALIRSMDRIR
ncbi:DUF4293 domain-containing protein [Marinilabilia rubra]|uniref:DUF4293 domain-containing protein n=1 Tax=Marinilabilia rubra TaxID=2162893 RepID=A0A2U2B3S4_9BACT|nr:DUF4293 domain-containing protein [Marinilabilia rubra]PWD97710.1 DUF4293 domain-containing protein [Marinilabilia rubra]